MIIENEKLDLSNQKLSEEIQSLREKLWQLSSENERLVEALHHSKNNKNQNEEVNADSFKTASFPEMERELRDLKRAISESENHLRRKEEQLNATSRALEMKSKDLEEWEARFRDRGREISPERKKIEFELIAKDTRIRELEQSLRDLQVEFYKR